MSPSASLGSRHSAPRSDLAQTRRGRHPAVLQVECLEDRRLLSAWLVADIEPGPDRSSAPDNLADVNGTLYFSANGPEGSSGLWKSDGTAAGTQFVTNKVFPGKITAVGDRAF